jgi:hypothetical protein
MCPRILFIYRCPMLLSAVELRKYGKTTRLTITQGDRRLKCANILIFNFLVFALGPILSDPDAALFGVRAHHNKKRPRVNQKPTFSSDGACRAPLWGARHESVRTCGAKDSYLTAAFASGSPNGSGTATAASLAAFGLGEETWSSGRAPASRQKADTVD